MTLHPLQRHLIDSCHRVNIDIDTLTTICHNQKFQAQLGCLLIRDGRSERTTLVIPIAL